MEEVITTVYYDGRFWKALVEKFDDNDKRFLAEYTFGPEPSAGDLFEFYLNRYDRLVFVESADFVRPRKMKKDNTERVNKSHTAFKAAQQAGLEERKKDKRLKNELLEKEKYLKKKLKKKDRKRGH